MPHRTNDLRFAVSRSSANWEEPLFVHRFERSDVCTAVRFRRLANAGVVVLSTALSTAAWQVTSRRFFMRRLRPFSVKGIESLPEITSIESHPDATRSDEGGSAPASALTKAGEQSLGLPRPLRPRSLHRLARARERSGNEEVLATDCSDGRVCMRGPHVLGRIGLGDVGGALLLGNREHQRHRCARFVLG